ncbi:MAG: hypothetical protein ACJ71T_04600 [Actinomycetales bacterium]
MSTQPQTDASTVVPCRRSRGLAAQPRPVRRGRVYLDVSKLKPAHIRFVVRRILCATST